MTFGSKDPDSFLKNLEIMNTENISTSQDQNQTDSPIAPAAQTNPNLYNGTNYIVRLGLPDKNNSLPFIFSISQAVIDFGKLYPTNPITRTLNLNLSKGSAAGYSIIASQDHPLKDSFGDLIPDTTCDNGSCLETTSNLWTNTLTYGYGYRCDGADCSTGFEEINFYKQFADESKEESAQTIMSSQNKQANIKGQVTYKVNIAVTQAQGNYGNVINYIAVPNF